MQNINKILVTLIFTFCLDRLAVYAASPRSDFRSIIDNTFCQTAQYPTTPELWELGIFDGGIELQTVVPKGNQPLSLLKLKKASHHLASRYGHRGLAYGVCPNMTAWSMSSPSPVNIVKHLDDKSIQVRLSVMRKYCRSLRVDFAPEQVGRLRKIFTWKGNEEIADATISLDYLATGTISITCRPKDRSQGAELWTLVPVQEFRGKLPHQSELDISKVGSIVSWVNRVRRLASLTPLKIKRDHLQNTAQRLSSRFGSRHDRQLLRQEKKALAAHGIKFLGENRAIASNYSEIVWLFWFSPRHRALLLSDRATHIAVAETRGRGQIQVVIVTAGISGGTLASIE